MALEFAVGSQAPGDFDAGHLGHLDIEERELRAVLGDRFQRQFAITDVGDDFELRPQLVQLGLELRPEDGFILGNDRGDWHR